MPGSSPVSSLPYALLTDVPDANALSQGLTTALDHNVIPKYATTTARGTANPTPTVGDLCYVTGTGRGYYSWQGSSWIGPFQFDQGFTSYTPTWTTSTGLHSPAIGNGVLLGTFYQLGKAVFFSFLWTAGTTTTFGSGATTGDNWLFSLPVAANTTLNAGLQQSATFNLAQTASLTVQGQMTLFDATHFEVQIASGRVDGTAVANSGITDSLSPWTWTATTANQIGGGGIYIAA